MLLLPLDLLLSIELRRGDDVSIASSSSLELLPPFSSKLDILVVRVDRIGTGVHRERSRSGNKSSIGIVDTPLVAEPLNDTVVESTRING
jgi:hypothetical protein